MTLKQKRVVNRSELRPMIDLAAYTCRAVIDWLDVEVSVGAPTQHQWIGQITERVLGRRAFVEAINPDAGKVATEFKIRVQEPKLTTIRELLAEIAASKGGVDSAVLAGIEVSLDFFADDNRVMSRAELYAVIARHLSFDLLKPRSVGRLPRSYGSTRKTFFLVRTYSKDREVMLQQLEDVSSDHPPALSSTFYIGERGDKDFMLRLQHKVTDNRNPRAGTFDVLDDEERRVRLEVALSAAAMVRYGLRTLDDLQAFKFTDLQHAHFRFRLPTFGPLTTTPSATIDRIAGYQDKVRLQKFKASGMIGLAALDGGRRELAKCRRRAVRRHVRELGKDLKDTTTIAGPDDLSIAWGEMMEKVEQALRHLGERV